MSYIFPFLANWNYVIEGWTNNTKAGYGEEGYSSVTSIALCCPAASAGEK